MEELPYDPSIRDVAEDQGLRRKARRYPRMRSRVRKNTKQCFLASFETHSNGMTPNRKKR